MYHSGTEFGAADAGEAASGSEARGEWSVRFCARLSGSFSSRRVAEAEGAALVGAREARDGVDAERVERVGGDDVLGARAGLIHAALALRLQQHLNVERADRRVLRDRFVARVLELEERVLRTRTERGFSCRSRMEMSRKYEGSQMRGSKISTY